MQENLVPRSVGIHDGTFHADEVMACALLILFDLVDEHKVVRTRDPELLERCEFVCDVGGIYDSSLKRFDHHQLDYQGPLSSAGMILAYLKGIELLTEKEYNYLNSQMILGIDQHDTGISTTKAGTMSLSILISLFNPVEHDSDQVTSNTAFKRALEFALNVLRLSLKKYAYNQSCIEKVKAAMEEKKEYLFFEGSVAWLDAFFELGGKNHPARFVLIHSRDQWKLRAIPPSVERRMEMRLAFPESWAGLSDEKLEEASGIQGAIFCHKGRFFSVWKTKEAALEALEKTIKQS